MYILICSLNFDFLVPPSPSSNYLKKAGVGFKGERWISPCLQHMLNLGVEIDLEISTLSSYHITTLQKEYLNSGPPKYEGWKDVSVINVQKGVCVDV